MSWLPDADPKPGDTKACDLIEQVIVPRARDLGGFEVRRALPAAGKQMIGPFIFFDQMGPAEFLIGQGIDVRPHPHIGLATVTYLFDGEIVHRDSLGTELSIRPGALNLMTAGRGIVHSERTAPEVKATGPRLFGIQAWVAVLPLDPDYDERGVFIVSGEIDVAGETFGPGRLLVFRPGDRISMLANTQTRLMIVGGDPMDGPRHIWWNFVSSSKERIDQAKADWRAGRFDTVPGDATEFIPLPES
jgi:redox-sensitive bicupin YhaK (pirin superfamily)